MDATACRSATTAPDTCSSHDEVGGSRRGPRGADIVLVVGHRVRIAPGDLLFGDREGVLVIPRAAEREAISRALDKATAENKVATAIRGGMGAAEAFATFGVM